MSSRDTTDEASEPLRGPSPFHEGEIAVQERCGVRVPIERVGRVVIRDAMPLQHQQFFAQLPLIFVGHLDASGRPWSSVLTGPAGFVHAIDARTLRFDTHATPGDPFRDHLRKGSPLGILGIEPATRRRNRMNGTVEEVDDRGFTVVVDQSFGNCPQYIQARGVQQRRDPEANVHPKPIEAVGSRLGGRAVEIVRSSDTLFLASASAQARGHAGPDGADVSHRGGKPGFVRLRTSACGAHSVLVIPDFRGNFLFNTLGNLTVNPRAGLLFIDFASGDLLQLTGRAEVVWEGPELASFAGAQRLVVVTVEEGLLHPGALPLVWSEPAFASQLEETGSWGDPAP